MTRIAQPGGCDLLKFARAFHALSPYAALPFDPNACMRMFSHLEESEDGVLITTPDGFCGGLIMPLWFSPQTRVATELFWFTRGHDGAWLRETFEAWAREKGCNVSAFSALANEREPGLRRIMARAGYHASEVSFQKAI